MSLAISSNPASMLEEKLEDEVEEKVEEDDMDTFLTVEDVCWTEDVEVEVEDCWTEDCCWF